ncbi:type II secretion system protein GspC [Seongchinamella unica]|uniref:Type II secretion system protein GspC n=1 Tax=Seongchinamella unica TaxID=2547392 RepID=A0A4R5LWZ9_9GAMM|nr:type II secretion system protein GspC [Seongchinamella unica]
MGASLESAAHALAEPARARRLRQLVIAALLFWLLVSVASLFWSLYPTEPVGVPADLEIVNPVTRAPNAAGSAPVDIARLQELHLFGEIGADEPVAAVVEAVETVDASRDGIEEGARETRLQLLLRGVVASTEDGLGIAIIEHRKKQAVYAVGDELPEGSKVVLAKVMPRQVVLDNNGTYELLSLFEENELDAQLTAAAPSPRIAQPVNHGAPALVDKRNDATATELAQSYRDRLYQNPQSLAEVVSVNAVRRDGQLLGYRVSPGKDKQQFAQLGFKAGDLVTSVNGIDLNDPANTMRLYQTMRTASEAVFDLQRGDELVSISVSLDQGE